MDAKRPHARPASAIGIGLLVIPLATICALSLIPERSAFAVGMPMARQLVLFLEERSRRVDFACAEVGSTLPDIEPPADDATPAASVPGVGPAIRRPALSRNTAPQDSARPRPGREIASLPPLRGPPC